MIRYRRNFVPGGTYFFTVTLADRTSRVLTEHIAELRHAVRRTRSSQPFAIDAIVVLPEHLHVVMTLPEGDADYPNRWRLIKRRFTDGVLKSRVQVSRAPRDAVWQRRYWEHTIRDDKDFERHLDYIHFNPIKHRLVERVRDWPYSSFHHYVRRGVLPEDWAGDFSMDAGKFGEPSG
ncbi:MAG TPA: transposase [Xanthobacteraceae bacterium]|nr:transposase [Xanthobacteraceae bacterium]